MNLDAFLTCLGYFGISTGASESIEGIYSFASGTTGIIYNQFYSTGSHFQNGQPYAPVIPLVNATQKVLSNNFFSGLNCYHVGYQHTGNFSLILEIESSGCLKRSQSNGKDGILVSTIVNHSGFGSGFIIGVNDANRIYFRTQGLQYMIDKELSLHDFVYVGLAQNKYVNFGVFNVSEDALYSKSIIMPSASLSTPDIYIGSFLKNTLINDYNGFYGKINQAILFNDTITTNDINTCVDCSFATGYTKITGTFSLSGIQITGTQFSGIQQSALTGQVNITGSVLRNDNTLVNIIFASGLTGLVTTGELALPLFNNVSLTGFRDVYTFYYDTGYRQSFSQFSVNFDLALTSGDVVEIYTYLNFNANVNLGFDNITWPTGNGFIQLFGNGLAETSGVDFFVAHNAISGFTTDDTLMYDILIAPTQVFDYSGYWQQSRIPLSGGGFFPAAPQFYETAGITGQIFITGLSGICTGNPYYPNFGYDIYLNGQKLVSGLQYGINPSGTSGFVVALSGANLPSFTATVLTESVSGLVTGIAAVDDSELTFMPQFSGITRYLFTPTGTIAVFGTLTGFSEQIWVNGIRQRERFDYEKIVPCKLFSGFLDLPEFTFNVYDTQTDPTGYWAVNYPPSVVILDNFWSGFTSTGSIYEVDFDCSSLNGYPTGRFVEVLGISNSDTIGYRFITYMNTNDTIFNYSTHTLGAECWTFRLRYHSGNSVGASADSAQLCTS
jgi:hypothetical protein